MHKMIVPVFAVLALAACETENGSTRMGQLVNPCNADNVPSGQRASVLHQDLPGGSDCNRSSAQRAYEAPAARARY